MTTHFARSIGRVSHTSAVALLALAALGCSQAARAEKFLFFDGEAAYSTDDNVTRGLRDRDIEKDTFFSAALGATYLLPITQGTRAVFRGTLRRESFGEFTGLSNTTGSVTSTLQFRRAGSFVAPTFSAFFKIGVAEYESELRDSTLYSIGGSVRKPLTDRVSLNATVSKNIRDSDSTVFDTHEDSILGNVDYAISSSWTLYLTYNYLRGDVTSTSSGTPWLAVIDESNEINLDDAFGSGHSVYQLDGKTHVATIGTNFRVVEGHSLDLSARYIRSDTDGDFTYERVQASVAYLIRF